MSSSNTTTTSNTKIGAGKVAVVTGSSRGLGAAMVKRLAKEGYTVVVNYISREADAVAVAKGVGDAGGTALVVQGDVSSVAGVSVFWGNVDKALLASGREARVDVIVANAGIILMKPFEEVSEAEYDDLFNTNVKGVFFLIQHGLKRLNDGGRIVTLGSGLSRVANPAFSAYAGTKGAIDTMTRVWAQALGARGITVNTLAPGAINTDMNKKALENNSYREYLIGRTALARIGEADDIGDILAFLAGPDSRWVTAQRIEASGGAFLM